MIDESKVAERFAGVGPELNERQRRLWVASEARALGYGGIAAVSRATGISEDTVGRGLKDVEDPCGRLTGMGVQVGVALSAAEPSP